VTDERRPTLSTEGFDPDSWRLLIGVVIVAALGALAYWRYSNPSLDPEGPIRAGSARLTLERDDGQSLTKIGRRPAPELWYRVTLDEAPLGARQHLRCEWIDPNGTVERANGYETKAIDHLPWETHARLRLRADAPIGQWRAILYRDDEQLRALSFEVIDE
jgi:hypothetical protein